MVITKVFFKTYIIKELSTGQGLGLTIPQNIISYKYLRNIIEKNCKHPEEEKVSPIIKLHRKLIGANISPEYYSTYISNRRGKYEMVKNGTQLEIYVNNNGIKENIRYFDNEVEACDYFFDFVYNNVKEDEKKLM